MTKDQGQKILYSFVSPLMVALIVSFIGIRASRSTTIITDIQTLKETKADRKELDKKVDLQVFEEHKENEGKMLEKMSQQIEFLYQNEIKKGHK